MSHDHHAHGDDPAHRDHAHHDHADHSHGAHAGHGHSHARASFGNAFAIAAALNITLVAAQIVFGVLAHSVALLADAGHNFGDVLGLLLAWGAHGMAQWRPTRRYTYGFRSASILAALFNGLILVMATGAIAWEAIRRLFEPGPVGGTTVMIVAAIGMVGDAALSFGVVVTGAAIAVTAWNWLDPLASLVISAFIVWSTSGLLWESVKLSLAAVPEDIDQAKVEQYLKSLPGVREVHDLHIWAMSTTETALTAHLVRPGAGLDDRLLNEAAIGLDRNFRIKHATLQVEAGDTEETCRLAPDHVV
jgi:cobalt-zinc-cadmium efflux system protein